MRLRLLAALIACLACLPAVADKVVLGKLGQALQSSAIYSRPSVRSHVYYRVKPYQYLVLRSARSNAYYKVLLQNGAFGYIPASYVATLPYSVTANRSETPALAYTPLSSRSDTADARMYAAEDSLRFKGVRYKWGGTNPASGIDCSAFVKLLYGEIGIQLPRTAAEQAMVGTPVRRLEDLQPGDRLYFWSFKRNMIGHTGIYLGNGFFEHSSSNHHGVATDYLGTKKWLSILVAARR